VLVSGLEAEEAAEGAGGSGWEVEVEIWDCRARRVLFRPIVRWARSSGGGSDGGGALDVAVLDSGTFWELDFCRLRLSALRPLEGWRRVR